MFFFFFFHKFTQKLYIFHWVLLYKWTFKIVAISITQEFHRLIYPLMVDAPECGQILITIVTEDMRSRFHIRAWRTSLWSTLTRREAQRDRPTDTPVQGRLLQEEPDECGHEGPQSRPPEQTHRGPSAGPRPARGQAGPCEAVWPRACLRFVCLPVDPTVSAYPLTGCCGCFFPSLT